jgi:hypothetical protein
MQYEIDPTLRDLYPNLSDVELLDVQDSLDQYAELLLRIYERICADPSAYDTFQQLLKKQCPPAPS